MARVLMEEETSKWRSTTTIINPHNFGLYSVDSSDKLQLQWTDEYHQKRIKQRVFYRGYELADGGASGKPCQAYELYKEWQKTKKDKNDAQKKVDDHMDKLEKREAELKIHYAKFGVKQ